DADDQLSDATDLVPAVRPDDLRLADGRVPSDGSPDLLLSVGGRRVPERAGRMRSLDHLSAARDDRPAAGLRRRRGWRPRVRSRDRGRRHGWSGWCRGVRSGGAPASADHLWSPLRSAVADRSAVAVPSLAVPVPYRTVPALLQRAVGTGRLPDVSGRVSVIRRMPLGSD